MWNFETTPVDVYYMSKRKIEHVIFARINIFDAQKS